MDWLDERINLDYNNENLAENPHLEYLRRLEGKIMMFVSSAKDGIGHLELASNVEIDRKNLTPHLKRLMRKGLITRGKGKRGKYYPASKKYRGISVTADIFSKAAAAKILANEDFPINSPYIVSGIVDNYPLDNALFKFSNGVGAIITYLLIQSLNRSNEILGRDAKNAKEQDINVNRWFKDGISTLGDLLLALFKEYMGTEILALFCNKYFKEDGTYDQRWAFEDCCNYGHTRPLFTLDEKYIKSLMMSFRRTYPSISNLLDGIRSKLPEAAIRQMNWIHYTWIRNRQQKICNHVFKPPRNTSLSDRYVDEVLHCSNCHKTKFIKR
jgi:B-block binding subunit of TFIIIC